VDAEGAAAPPPLRRAALADRRQSSDTMPGRPSDLDIHPVNPARWADLCKLFGDQGAYSGCWCMWWRQSRRAHASHGSAGNRRAMEGLIRRGVVPGLLAYAAGQPVGWCSVGPRRDFASLDRSRTLRYAAAEPVWSVACFYVQAGRRRAGLSRLLLDAAVEHAWAAGAATLLGYPVPAAEMEPLGTVGFMGSLELFEAAGFRRVTRPRKRWIVELRREGRPAEP
jgi:GNAT superfamily N-acetyltransferase